MRILFPALVVCGFAFGVAAQAACPPAPDIRSELLNLITKAQSADNFSDGRRVSNQMWEVWLRAPDEVAQVALDAGMRRREVGDFAGALKEFDRLAEYCPMYAEGFNQRAFVNFLRGDFDTALTDLDIALELQPFHIAAQSGRALTLMNLGRMEEARAQLLKAVDLNPWLSERALLADGAPLGLPGEEL